MNPFYLIKKTQSLPDKTLRNPVANEEQQWIELSLLLTDNVDILMV